MSNRLTRRTNNPVSIRFHFEVTILMKWTSVEQVPTSHEKQAVAKKKKMHNQIGHWSLTRAAEEGI